MNKGFTLVELLAVVFLIGILAGLFIPLVYNSIEKAEKQTFIVSSKKLVQAAEKYFLKEEALNHAEAVGVTVEELRNKNYIKNTGDFDNSVIVLYKIFSNNNKILYEDYYLYAADGKYVSDGCLMEELEECVEKGEKIVFDLETVLEGPPTDPSCFTFDSGTKTITAYDFQNCGNVVTIPTEIEGVQVENIGHFAFINQADIAIQICLTDEIGNGVSTDPAYIHYEGDGYIACVPLIAGMGEPVPYYPITKVNMSEGIKTIGDFAFAYNHIQEISFPNSLISLGDGVLGFNGYSGAINLNGTFNTIGEYAFSYNNITSVSIPNSVTSIKSFAFASNYLTSLSLPNNLISISTSAFSENLLTNVSFGTSLTTINYQAFAHNNLTTLNFPSSLIGVESEAFLLNAITNITINSGVTIGDNMLAPLNNQFRTSYLAGGAGTYTGTQAGAWTKQ